MMKTNQKEFHVYFFASNGSLVEVHCVFTRNALAALRMATKLVKSPFSATHVVKA